MAMVKDDILDLTIGKVPMLKALLLYITGILIAVGSNSDLSPKILLIGIGLLLFLFVVLSYFKSFSQKHLFSLCFSGIVIFYGYYQYANTQSKHIKNYYFSYPALQYVGIVDDEPIYKEKTIRFPVKLQVASDSAQSSVVSGKVMMTILRDSLAIQKYSYGDKLAFVNKLNAVHPPFNPKEFDYKAYLANKGIEAQCLLNSEEVEILDKGYGDKLIAYSLDLRTQLIAKFRNYIKEDEAFNVAVALIFGYRSQIDQSTISAFTSTGTIHVLSVSGLHVSLVFALLNFVFRWMDRFPYGRLLKSIIILLAIWAYVILTGMSPPILRAGIMISFFVSSILINRKQIPLNTLAASALFILLFSPNYLFDVGFQLSYFAILGIILLYPILKNYYLTPNKWFNYVLEYVYVSIAAQLFTLPLTLYYFGQFPNYFLLANLFIAIPSTLIMYVGIGLVMIPLEWTNQLLGKIVEWLLNFMMSGLKGIEQLPAALVYGVDWHWSQVLILGIGILTLVVALNSKVANGFIVLMSALFVLTMFNSYNYFHKSNYSALKFYNIRSEIGISLIKDNKVMLYSSLDSLQHSILQFSVLPDLRLYSSEDKMGFTSIAANERQNKLIELGNYKILILEIKTSELPSEVDFVLWRKNNYTDIDNLLSLNPKAIVIVDGSSSDKTIARLKNAFESNSDRLYILKNNFAYVWEEE